MIALHISGNLAAPPEVKFSNAGGRVFGFRMATNHTFTEYKKLVKATQWSEGLVSEGKLQYIFDRLVKGRCVHVFAPRVRVRIYQKRDGAWDQELKLGQVSIFELGPSPEDRQNAQENAATQSPAPQPGYQQPQEPSPSFSQPSAQGGYQQPAQGGYRPAPNFQPQVHTPPPVPGPAPGYQGAQQSSGRGQEVSSELEFGELPF